MILLKCLFEKKEEKTIKEKINNVDAKKKIFSVAKFFNYLIFFRTSLYFEEELFLNDANYFFYSIYLGECCTQKPKG